MESIAALSRGVGLRARMLDSDEHAERAGAARTPGASTQAILILLVLADCGPATAGDGLS